MPKGKQSFIPEISRMCILIYTEAPCPSLHSCRHSQGIAPRGSRMEYQQTQDSPRRVIRAASNIGHAQMQPGHTTCLSKDLTPCAMLTKIGKLFMKPFFFSETVFFFSVKQNKYIQFKIIFSSKKIQIAWAEHQ